MHNIHSILMPFPSHSHIITIITPLSYFDNV